MNYTYYSRMQADFDKMLLSDIPGQNYDCDLIADVGNGFPNTGHSVATRCVCYSSTASKSPTLRTSLSDPLRQGNMVYISQRDSGLFYILENEAQQMPNCYTAVVTRCNVYVTIKQTVPPQTDELGYAVGDGKEKELTLLKRIPAVARHAQALTTAQNAAGLRIADTLTLTTQLNEFTSAVPVEAWFMLDKERYTVRDVVTDNGIVTFYCSRQAGCRE